MRSHLFVVMPIFIVMAAGPATADDDPTKDFILSHLTGTVHDPNGKPIERAKVHLNSMEGPYVTRDGNWAFTGADGKYSARVFVKPKSKAVVTGVIVSAKGFVQLRERFLLEEVVLEAGKDTELNFVLAGGEVLAGKVETLHHGGPKSAIKPEEHWFILTVRGPSFKEYFQTEKGGRFEIWVPKGLYTMEVDAPFPLRLENVPSGSSNLKLTVAYPRPSEKELARTFDALWDEMDRHYSYFVLKKIDWKTLKDRYKSKAIAAHDLREFVDILKEMLGHLHDGHVWVAFEGRNDTHVNRADANYNHEVVWNALEKPAYCNNFAFVGITKTDGFGAFVVTKQGKADKESVQQAVDFIRAHHDAPGFLVDLREAGGGNELLALGIAREFCGKDAVYAKSKSRAGPGHDDFGRVDVRELVVCLIGPQSVSSGEGFVQMMKCLPNVTTVGARTRGSSGNPRAFILPGVAVTVWYSRWVDLMPDGTPIEDAGIAPDLAVNGPADAYKEKDPTWEEAIEVLRRKASRQ